MCKFLFIICSNNDIFLEECLYYISQLYIPEGCEVDAISISASKNIAVGYNEGMAAVPDATYKIYLHQDVFILYRGFLYAILEIFQSDPSIGMIGMVGSPKMSPSGVMWYGHLEGSLYGMNSLHNYSESYQYCINDGITDVEVIDGLMMITSNDLPWREDILDGWDFYDVSQSIEFRRAGYRIVVPNQRIPWCFHDDQGRTLNRLNYNNARKKCMKAYPDYFSRPKFISQINSIYDKLPYYQDSPLVLLMVRNQYQLTIRSIRLLLLFSGVKAEQLLIVDNGSEDGFHLWLTQQTEYNYLICNEVIESYSNILNEVFSRFAYCDSVLLLTPDILPLPGSITTLKNQLSTYGRPGILSAQIIDNNTPDVTNLETALEYAIRHNTTSPLLKVNSPLYPTSLISRSFWYEIGGADPDLISPTEVLADLSFRGNQAGCYCYSSPNSFFYRISQYTNIYINFYDK